MSSSISLINVYSFQSIHLLFPWWDLPLGINSFWHNYKGIFKILFLKVCCWYIENNRFMCIDFIFCNFIEFDSVIVLLGASLVAQMVKHLPAWYSRESDPLEKEMATNPLQYSCLKNSMDRGAGGLQSTGSQRAWHDWATNIYTIVL